MIKIKRAYEPFKKQDGYRVLIDRLWPRGIKKSDLPLDEWIKDLAPSTELRKNFGHEPSKWVSFRKEYKSELRAGPAREKLLDLAKRASRGTVTLVYSAKDTEHNDAVVLKDLLDRELKKRTPSKKTLTS
jgi:uncharacterized protein YeaO (DUF488 family)